MTLPSSTRSVSAQPAICKFDVADWLLASGEDTAGVPATAGDASDGLTEEAGDAAAWLMAAAGDAPAELPLSAAASSDMLLVSLGEAGTDLLVPAEMLQPSGDALADVLVAPGAGLPGSTM